MRLSRGCKKAPTVACSGTWILVAWWHPGSHDEVAQEPMLCFFKIWIISFKYRIKSLNKFYHCVPNIFINKTKSHLLYKFLIIYFLFSSQLHPDAVSQTPSLFSLTHHIQSTKQNILHARNLTLPSLSHYIGASLDHAKYQTYSW
jgi:hypothetical protein